MPTLDVRKQQSIFADLGDERSKADFGRYSKQDKELVGYLIGINSANTLSPGSKNRVLTGSYQCPVLRWQCGMDNSSCRVRVARLVWACEREYVGDDFLQCKVSMSVPWCRSLCMLTRKRVVFGTFDRPLSTHPSPVVFTRHTTPQYPSPLEFPYCGKVRSDKEKTCGVMRFEEPCSPNQKENMWCDMVRIPL